MSRKTIAFQVPRKEPVARELTAVLAPAAIEAEHWVSRTEPAHEVIHQPVAEAPKESARAAAITLTISAEPELLEAAWIGLFLPSAVFWLWGISATQRSLQFFAR